MHRCSSSNNNSSSQGNIVGPCTCDLFHSQTNSFSMLFSMPNHNKHPFDEETEIMYSSSSSSSSSSSVDCTLSLGTPSTRLSDEYSQRRRPTTPNNNNNNSYMSNFCWDILQQSNKHSSSNNYSSSAAAFRNSRGGGNSSNTSNVSDPLVARRCANCDTTSTPLWRNGPRGPKSLCNACGIRFKKEERRASAAAATTTTTTNGGAGGGVLMDAQAQHMMINSHHHHYNNNNNAWAHSQQTQKMACLSPAIGNEFRFIDEDDDRDSDTGIPFLSWRLNVTDRPTSLVHDFTR